MADKSSISVLAFSGSLRAGSFNRALLKTAQSLAPSELSFRTFERIGEFPPYNEDVRARGFPPAVEELRQQIKAAEALLIVTPEYNYSIPGVLKNAIDWASRPPDQPFLGKPIGLMGASAGALGTARAQYDLRRCFVFLEAYVMNRPEVFVGAAQTKFDDKGECKDQPTKDIIRQMLEAFVKFVRKVG